MAALLTLPAQAADTLAVAVDAAWQRAVVARAAIGEQRAAEAVADSARRWWAEPPAIALSHQSDRWYDDFGRRETAVDLSLPLWLPGQQSAYNEAASAGLALAQAAQRATRWRIAGEVRELAWHVVALQAEADQVAAAADSLARLSADVSRRVDAGELPRIDLLATQAEVLAVRNRLGGIERQVSEVALQWRTLTGLEDLPDAAMLTETLPTESGIGDHHPAVQAADNEAASATQQLNLVRHSRSAAPELTVGWRREVGARGLAAENSVVVGVRVPFGTDDRNKPLLARAEAAADVASTRALRLREQLAASVIIARDALRLSEAQADAALAQARLLRERSDLIERAFDAGELALAERLRALAAASEAATAAARQQALLGLARARLLQSLGQYP